MSSSFEITGKLLKKFDTENKTGSFQAREFVLEVDGGNFPQMVKFQLVQDRCTLIDPCSEGESIKVHFDLRGREWNGKYFTNLNAWRIEKVTSEAPAASGASPAGGGSFPTAADEPATMDFSDDLPF